MTKQTHQYSDAQFTTSFFEYDVSKYRTKTAVPFHEQRDCCHFAEYAKPEFHFVSELDSIFRFISEVDARLAKVFEAKVKDELTELFDEFTGRLSCLIDDYAYRYAHDEEYVKEQLFVRTFHHMRKKIAA